MQEMTIEGFLRLYKSQHGQEANYMAIEVTVPGTDHTELLINDKGAFDFKTDYIAKTYDENLVHKHNPEIRIVNYAFEATYLNLLAQFGRNGMDATYMYVKYQEGTEKEVGINGVQVEDVILAAINRLEIFQDGAHPCRENALAITKLQEAFMWLNERTRKRVDQDVEGTHQDHQ